MCQECGKPEKGDGILHLLDAIIETSDSIVRECKRQNSLELEFLKNFGLQKTESVAWHEDQMVKGFKKVNLN
jgi:hypothetical protein